MEWLSVGVKQAGMQRGGFCWWKRKLSVLFFSSFEMQIDSTSWYNLPPFAQPQSASTGKHRANNPQLLIVRHLCCFPRLGGGGWTFFPIRFPVLKIDTSFLFKCLHRETPPPKNFWSNFIYSVFSLQGSHPEQIERIRGKKSQIKASARRFSHSKLI